MIELQQAAVRRLLQSAVRRLYSVDGGGRRSILIGGWKQSATAAYSSCMHKAFNLKNQITVTLSHYNYCYNYSCITMQDAVLFLSPFTYNVIGTYIILTNTRWSTVRSLLL